MSLLLSAGSFVVELPSVSTMVLIVGACCLAYALSPQGQNVPTDKRTAYWAGAGLLIGALALGGADSDTVPTPVPDVPAPDPHTPNPTPNPEPYTPTPTPNPEPNPTPHPPTPAPTPTPTPTPIPVVPLNDFQKSVVSSWKGSRDEALVFAGMFTAMADGMAFDGSRANPKILTSNDLGMVFNDMQRYVGLAEAPWGGRFAETKHVIANQMELIGVSPRDGSPPIEFSPTVRAAAVSLYREVGLALSQVP